MGASKIVSDCARTVFYSQGGDYANLEIETQTHHGKLQIVDRENVQLLIEHFLF